MKHHPNDTIRPDNHRPARCLRHSVWMAVCDDCRSERADRVAAARDRRAANR